MSQEKERKRRKLYLVDSDAPFVVPSSTLWYNKQRPITPSTSAAQPLTDALPDDAADTADTANCDENRQRGIGVAASNADTDDSALAYLSDAQPPRTTSEAGITSDDLFDDEQTEFVDAVSESGCSGEDSDHTDEERSDPANGPVPQFHDTELLAQCVRHFGNKTLPSSSTTLAEAVVLIMAFVVAHGLTWSAVDDLLKLVDALFGHRPSGLPRSKYLFRKLWAPKCEQIAQRHYYCELCMSLLEMSENKRSLHCTICQLSYDVSEVKKKGCFFAIMDIKEQLQHIIARVKELLFSSLSMLRDEQSSGNVVTTDIANGAICKGLRQMGLMKWSDLTLTVNTDGSPLYKSSNASIWPIQLSINELPQPHRNANTFLAGLWFGRKHPDMALFIGKFVKALQMVGEIVWQHGAVDLISRVYLACVCVDAPARAAVGNQTQFNGCFGCPWCLACGTLQEGRRLYINSEPPAPERTAAGIRRDMKLAMELQTPVNGLKGPSAFWPLQYLDLVECYTVEYMHCVLLGVTRQFTEYWFDSSHCHEKFYIGRPSTLNFLNRRLKGIQPPHHITRLPRSIQERHFWKAHEWRNWLLYYCLPCCQNTLLSPYMKHFAILSEAIFLLLQEQLSPPAIAQAGEEKSCMRCGNDYASAAATGATRMIHVSEALCHTIVQRFTDEGGKSCGDLVERS
ncbi:hypothetical protein HPB49_017064 [Dermacentor silvarum]|uniref:Uncharacterized protein n=1 Tax=Dermacentor silvarum TaxID=543639 RepID=A0ACB8DPX1_DERSI|nr:hypothetical protein HPB49_017064 [Dermacentor silvarum]